MFTNQKIQASVAAMAAVLSLGPTPAAAIDLPAVSTRDVAVVTGAADDANQHRWRRHRHRDNDIDAGDVVAGVLVIGAIAAIAGALDGPDDDRRYDRDYRDRNYRDRDYRERDGRDDRRGGYESNGLDRAADMCVAQVERGRDRVEEVAEARRTSDGWRVAGTLRNGEAWSCWIDNDGRVRNVDFGAANYSASDRDARYAPAASGGQWSDDAYASARASTRTPAQGGYSYRDEPAEAPAPTADGPQPAYPGGPLPGEEDPYADAPEWQGDGRYSAGEAPDFTQSND
jgi:hypothetical protein